VPVIARRCGHSRSTPVNAGQLIYPLTWASSE
jgi:hypothetical protein